MTRISTSAQETLDAISNDKQQLLKLLLERKSRQKQQIQPLPRPTDADAIRMPASLAQQRLWFIDQLEGGSAGYQVPLAVRLRGTLDQPALQRALDSLVQRHETLRTVFVSVEGEPEQEIAATGRFSLTAVDLGAQAPTEREAQVQLRKSEEVHEKFDLRRGPLIRGRLLRLAADEHVLLVTMHHIISDGWSKGVLIRELTALYAAYRDGRADPLPALSIQYADYAHWQRQWLHETVLDRQLDYWCEHLRGAAPELELPTDRPRPAMQSYRGENVPIAVDARLSAELKAFAQRHGLTQFMVLCGAWAILLARLSGQDDVVIGTPIANRQRPELEGSIGFFVNTLVLRIAARDDMRVQDFFEQVKSVTLGAYDHQDVPFEKVVEALQPQRNLARSLLFQAAFVLHNEPRDEIGLSGITAHMEGDVDEPAIVDLWLSLENRHGEIIGSVNYAADLFDRRTVEGWMECFAVLLRSIAQEVHSCVGELPILAAGERRRLLEVFNQPQRVASEHRLIHEWFEAQAESTPQSTALQYEGSSLNYAELNSRSNSLARYLRDSGVCPGDLVGIHIERGLEMVVGLLAILKAGAAYVPLDPQYPTERLAYMLQDAQPRVLLTQTSLKGKLPEGAAKLIALDAQWDEIAAGPTSNMSLRAAGLGPDHLAYVIYTSGSTGAPKGVMVTHRNVTRLFATTHHWFNFDEHDVWTLFHSIAFDFSVWELWGALLYGGRVVVVPHLSARSPADFYRLLCREGVTVLNQTPAAFAQLMHAQAQSEESHSLRLVIFGGEALEPRALRPWVERNGAERPQLVNMYGITETTVHVTYCPLTKQAVARERASLVGKPIEDLRIYLLDRRRQPVPVGVIGEIYVGGAGVARGYLNRPQLTAERFLEDPFSCDPSARLYRSGDLGRWRADATLEYLGRNDYQVKIRGYRIELGEIETQLAAHPLVREAVVVAREDNQGDKRLIAYVVRAASSSGTESPTAAVLRAHLRSTMPEYMVPSAFVVLERLPLTSNGKLDRRALPPPGMEDARRYEPPQGETEQVLAEIWQVLLGVERVGRHDNFFELGGHSLHGMRLIAKIDERCAVKLSAVAMFQYPTIQQMAETIEAARASSGERGGDEGLEFEEGVIPAC